MSRINNLKNQDVLFKKYISVFFILLIVCIPFNSYLIVAADDPQPTTADQELANSLGLGALPSPEEACNSAAEESSKFVEILDNKLISTVEKVAAIAHLVCVIMNTIDQIVNIIAQIIGMFQGACCKTGLSSPGGTACLKMDVIYQKFKITWPPMMKILCCIVSCGWCTGQGCGKIGSIDFGSIMGKITPLAQVPSISGGASASGIGQFSISPYSNIYVAAGCLCPTAVLFNLRKLKAIYQTYSCCVKQACKKGQSIDECGHFLNSATCMYWEGTVYKSLINVLMGFIAKYIGKFIPEFVLQSKLLNCALVLLDIYQAKDIIEGVKSSLGWLTETFEDPECEKLDTSEDGMQDELKDVRADSYALIMKGNEGKKIVGTIGAATGKSTIGTASGKDLVEGYNVKVNPYLYYAFIADNKNAVKTYTQKDFDLWLNNMDQETLDEMKQQYEQKFNEIKATGVSDKKAITEASSYVLQNNQYLVENEAAFKLYDAVQQAKASLPNGGTDSVLYNIGGQYYLSGGGVEQLIDANKQQVDAKIDLINKANGIMGGTYASLTGQIIPTEITKNPEIINNLQIISENLGNSGAKLQGGILGQSDLLALKDLQSKSNKISGTLTQDVDKVTMIKTIEINQKFNDFKNLDPESKLIYSELSIQEKIPGYNYDEAQKIANTKTAYEYINGELTPSERLKNYITLKLETSGITYTDREYEELITSSISDHNNLVSDFTAERNLLSQQKGKLIKNIESNSKELADITTNYNQLTPQNLVTLVKDAQSNGLQAYIDEPTNPDLPSDGQVIIKRTSITLSDEGDIVKGESTEVITKTGELLNIARNQIALPQAQYQMAFELLSQTLGKFAYSYVDKMCEDRWKSSESENKDAITTEQTNNLNTNVNDENATMSEICKTVSDQSITAQCTRAVSGSSFEYVYSYSLVSCDSGISYSVVMRANDATEISVFDGTASKGVSVSKRAGLVDAGQYVLFCIKYTKNTDSSYAEQCYDIAES